MKAATLLRLMRWTTLGGSLKLGPEDLIAIAFAARMRAWTIEGKLTAVWSHVPNEVAGGTKNAGIKYAIANALGMITGCPDYFFLWEGGSAVIEAKSKVGKQTAGQVDFQEWCEARNVPYFLIRSADEGEAILRQLGVLRT